LLISHFADQSLSLLNNGRLLLEPEFFMNDQSHEIRDLQLQVPDRFGVYLWWPQDGTDWIHPDDVGLACKLIPSRRIFQRVVEDETWSSLVYGDSSIRVKPTLWLEVESDGYLVGDRVEIRSRMGQQRPAIATIADMLWNRQQKSVEYFLATNRTALPMPFQFADIQPVFKLDEPMSLRQAELAAKSKLQ
jgi:hypothetical protein